MKLRPLLFALMLLPLPVCAADGPAGVVATVVGMDKGGWGTIFAEKPTALMQQYFSTGFNRSWANAMTHNQEEPVLDGDPITGWQSVSGVAIAKLSTVQGVSSPARVTADLKVTTEGHTKPERIIFTLVQEDQHWRIDDIKSQSMPSIRSYFRKSYGG